MKIKAAVIGVGHLGRHHARIYAEMDNVELVGVADQDMARASETAQKYGCRAYDDFRQLIENAQAVSVVTPTTVHHAVAIECLKKGKDLLVEKPITVTVDEADDLIRESEKRGLILQIGHLERYNPAVLALNGHIKDPIFFETERVSPFLERAADIDVTLDLMIHDIDIISSLVGGASVKEIKVTGAVVVSKKVDVAKAWIEFDSGASALVTASRLSDGKRRTMRIYQKESFIELDYANKTLKRFFKNDTGLTSEDIAVKDREPLKEELVDFIDCVSTRRRPKVSGNEGRNALRIAIDITEMIKKLG